MWYYCCSAILFSPYHHSCAVLTVTPSVELTALGSSSPTAGLYVYIGTYVHSLPPSLLPESQVQPRSKEKGLTPHIPTSWLPPSTLGKTLGKVLALGTCTEGGRRQTQSALYRNSTQVGTTTHCPHLQCHGHTGSGGWEFQSRLVRSGAQLEPKLANIKTLE